MKGIKVCNDCFDISSLKGGDSMKPQHMLLIILFAVLVGAGILFLGNKNKNSLQSQPVTSNPQGESTAVKNNSQPDTAGLAQRYVDYSTQTLTKATQNNGKAVIFFKASWCPSCVAADKDFQANFDKVLQNVTILKTDYDTATDLKKKYNITSQDTFVQVDSQGKEITKWNSGGQGIKALLANIK